MHLAPARLDTADLIDGCPGNLRTDYVLPAGFIPVFGAKAFWLRPNEASARLTSNFDLGQFPCDGIGFPTSDHRLVYADPALI